MKELVVIAVGLWLPFPSTFSPPVTAKDFGGFSFHPPGRGQSWCCGVHIYTKVLLLAPTQLRSMRKYRSSQVLWGFIRIPSLGPARLLQKGWRHTTVASCGPKCLSLTLFPSSAHFNQLFIRESLKVGRVVRTHSGHSEIEEIVF